jgi:phage/plasmid-associated DNA primase
MIPLNLNANKSKFFTKSDNGSIFPISPLLCSEIIVQYSDLQHMRIFKDSNCCYVYDKSQGIYVKFSLDYLKTLLRKLLKETKYENLYSYSYVTKVFNNLTIGSLSFPGFPSFDKGYVVFNNGILHLSSQFFTDHNPALFLSSKLPFDFDPEATCPLFNQFLLEICSGYLDRTQFLKAWMNVILYQRVSFQVFFVMVGPGASGKSTLATLATALTGKEATVTTSLRSLHKDPFELTNLGGKKLILLSDSERYQGDLQILKQIVGCDSLQGRIKFVQGSQEVTPEGIITVISNSPLVSKDNSNALTRRMRTFRTDKIFTERIPYLYYKDPVWLGRLSEELPGIFNEINSLSENQVYDLVVHMDKNVKSLHLIQDEHNQYINHLLHWVQEEITQGQGIYIGYKPPKSYKSLLDDTSRKNLYPAYISWCERKNIPYENHIKFTYDLLDILAQEGYKCEKVRRSKGMFVTGIDLREDVLDRDYLLGSQNENLQDIKPEELYQGYMKLLGSTELKQVINQETKESISEEIAIKITDEITKETKINTKEYYEKMLEQVKRGKDIINNFGIVPYSYKPLGVSPRIVPVNYGKTINGVKRYLREYAYILAGERCRALGYDIELVDVDLKSCYTSILLGLYPHYLKKIQDVIEKEGLWKHIEGEFKKRGKSEFYNKDSVKICTYSSFFQGGNKAMMEGIMDHHRKSLGMTPSQFRESSLYEEFHEKARGVVGEMQNSDIVLTMRELSTRVKEEYLGKEMKGPTGHSYKVTEESFKTAYPNLLQSYEFMLISQSVMGTLKRYNSVELIGHYHDGVVLAVPLDQKERVLESLQEELNKVRIKLGLSYKLDFEVKTVFRI